ncbi:polyserase-related [Holotrichia oblita]|uniref:Polyserase-related n=1 Tax=Holotrichia oblita TaxID=644536 RepID=A0ACB9TSG1_HOLOL|nr:polyserase-related [Holotrichia oblita]
MIKFAVLLAFVSFVAAVPTIDSDSRIDVTGDWKVVGGSNAATGAYPFIVSLRSSSNSHFCGGSIINNLWVLTAAHCLVGSSASSVNAVVGTNTLLSGGSSIRASRLLVHGNYNPNTIANDVGVIQLAASITYSNSVAQVSLNTADVGAVSAILIGWGRTSTGGSIPNNLQQLSTNTITTASCQSVWGSSVSSSQICAYTRSGQGACNGDSGGPLVRASDLAQLGIVSFGIACAQGFPDVYARVSSYNSWIQSAISS